MKKLLLSKTCRFCQDLENLDSKYKDVYKIYVENGIADINGEKFPVDPRIEMFPCLIDGLIYLYGVDDILGHLEKSGEMNATANIL